MTHSPSPDAKPAGLSRRAFVRWCLALPAPFLLAACSRGGAAARSAASPAAAPAAPPPAAPVGAAPPATTVPAATTATAATAAPAAVAPAPALSPTPACPAGAAFTPDQTEGPYFKPNSPERASLLDANAKGTKLVLTGQVLTKSCRPVARALLDFWQADDAGNYDNSGFKMRGHQFANADGSFRLETVVPGLYPGRTRHLHVKVQAPNQPALTTQLYFPNEPRNQSDGIFSKDLVMAVRDDGSGKAAAFSFVLNLS